MNDILVIHLIIIIIIIPIILRIRHRLRYGQVFHHPTMHATRFGLIPTTSCVVEEEETITTTRLLLRYDRVGEVPAWFVRNHPETG